MNKYWTFLFMTISAATGMLLQYFLPQEEKTTIVCSLPRILRKNLIQWSVIFPIVFWQPKVLLTKWVPYFLLLNIWVETKVLLVLDINPSGHIVKIILGSLIVNETANQVGLLKSFGRQVAVTIAWTVYVVLSFFSFFTLLNTCYAVHTIEEVMAGLVSVALIVCIVDLIDYALLSSHCDIECDFKQSKIN